jgi:hypothetical protein
VADLSTYELAVSRSDLAQALKTVTASLRKREAQRVHFVFDDEILTLTGPGAQTDVQASGTWPGGVLAEAAMLKQLATCLPNEDPLRLGVRDRRLFLGGFSIGAEVLEIAPPPLLLPMGDPNAAILKAVERYGEPRVLGTVSRASLENAKADLEMRIAQAAQSLAHYGVTRTDVTEMVTRVIARSNKAS